MSIHCTHQHLIEKKKTIHIYTMYKHTHKEYGFWEKNGVYTEAETRNLVPARLLKRQRKTSRLNIIRSTREKAPRSLWRSAAGLKTNLYIKISLGNMQVPEEHVSSVQTGREECPTGKRDLAASIWKSHRSKMKLTGLQGFHICFTFDFGGLSLLTCFNLCSLMSQPLNSRSSFSTTENLVPTNIFFCVSSFFRD